ncbi:hypothetical protein TNCV_1571801 [Trichonephila clavipes]|uniref:Uncharacterized protein n=1 Tax=Trichonephila clavipes TaxID=2585209 RepID=A0A8X6VP87_TRICX|nr:hypothetical protein TNCV_1571801 [Trichonephila clavipes]
MQLKTHRIEEPMHVKSVVAENYPFGLVWKFGKWGGCSVFRCRHHHWTLVHNYEIFKLKEHLKMLSWLQVAWWPWLTRHKFELNKERKHCFRNGSNRSPIRGEVEICAIS